MKRKSQNQANFKKQPKITVEIVGVIGFIRETILDYKGMEYTLKFPPKTKMYALKDGELLLHGKGFSILVTSKKKRKLWTYIDGELWLQ